MKLEIEKEALKKESENKNGKVKTRLEDIEKEIADLKDYKAEPSEYSSSDEYTYEDEGDSEGEFLPAQEGTEITTTTPKQQEKQNPSVPGPQARSHTEERRNIPVIRTMKKEKSPVKSKGKTDVYYFP